MNKPATLLLTGFLMFFSTCILAQTYDFEDTAIPVDWQGSRTDFQVSGTNQLQLNAPVGSTASSLFWPSVHAQNCSWELYVKYAFAASTTNYAVFYLFSTESDVTSVSNVAYYLKIGGAAGTVDKIELIYQQGTGKQVVLESRVGIVGGNQVTCRIHVIKNASGMWTLKTDTTGGRNYVKESSAQHWIENPFNYSGIRCVYSSTRRDKFYFDDISIQEPFAIQGYTFENDSTLKIRFNKTMSATSSPVIAINIDLPYSLVNGSNYLQICFHARIYAGTYSGTISNVFSANGDSLLDTALTLIKDHAYYVGQLRISEWMSDPSPGYGLPEVEWVELVNMSDQPVDLTKISISDPSSKARLPPYVLAPDSVVMVCSLHACNNFSVQNCIEVNALPGLNNAADSIFLWANDSLLIDFVCYDLASMSTDFRRDGGYSMIRKEYPEACVLSQKIDFAQDNTGGSPGFITSKVMTSALTIEAIVVSSKEVNMKMNARGEIIDTAFYSALGVSRTVNNGYRYGTSYTFYLDQELEAGSSYFFTINSVHTCQNKAKNIDAEVIIIYPKVIERNDVFVNEVLYNPNSGGVDFIEFYNPTSKYIQLQYSHLYNESNGTVGHTYVSGNRIIEPFGFITLTSDTAVLKLQYNNAVAENMFQLPGLLSLPDTGGKLMWLNRNGDTLDRISYGDIYQNPLLRNTEGYSLEKINSAEPDFYSANWTTSAVHTTPGYTNSQNIQNHGVQHKSFYCNPCHVTTNLNGANDFAVLYLGDAAHGCFGSIGIYRLSGEKVMDLVVNQLLGSTNIFQWNGQQQGGGLLEDGVYVAVAEWWSSSGQTFVSKIIISTSQY